VCHPGITTPLLMYLPPTHVSSCTCCLTPCSPTFCAHHHPATQSSHPCLHIPQMPTTPRWCQHWQTRAMPWARCCGRCAARGCGWRALCQRECVGRKAGRGRGDHGSGEGGVQWCGVAWAGWVRLARCVPMCVCGGGDRTRGFMEVGCRHYTGKGVWEGLTTSGEGAANAGQSLSNHSLLLVS
jgi:hypothetical protein